MSQRHKRNLIPPKVAMKIYLTLLMLCNYCGCEAVRPKVEGESRMLLPEITITTTFEEGSGSYGNMFDIKAMGYNDITIVGLDFHTDKKDSEVSYEIYTREVTYRGYESNPGGWEIVGSGTVTGNGAGTPTPIDRDTFTPVTVRAGSTKAFYFTLTTYDLRYTLGKKEGMIFASDENIGVTAGTGVAEYKFGKTFFRPRVWNGNIHYTANDDSNRFKQVEEPTTSSPTVMLTTPPTVVPRRVCTISYPMVMEYPKTGTKTDYYVNMMRDNVDKTLKSHLTYSQNIVQSFSGDTMTDDFFDDYYSFDDDGKSYAYDVSRSTDATSSSGKAYVTDVKTYLGSRSGRKLNCEKLNFLCTPVENVVSVEYEGSISEEDVRYQFLQYSPDVVTDVNNYMPLVTAKYEGALPVETSTVFTLSGEALSKINKQADKRFFEDSVKSFLDSVFSRSSFKTYGVNVRSQQTSSSRHLGEDRKMQASLNNNRQHHSSLDITATITGEYTPPPHTNIGELIDESIVENGNYLIDQLKDSEKFQGLSNLKSRSTSFVAVPTASPTTSPKTSIESTVMTSDSGRGNDEERIVHSKSNFLVLNFFTASIMLGIFGVFIGIVMVLKFSMSKKEESDKVLTGGDIQRIEDLVNGEVSKNRRGSNASRKVDWDF